MNLQSSRLSCDIFMDTVFWLIGFPSPRPSLPMLSLHRGTPYTLISAVFRCPFPRPQSCSVSSQEPFLAPSLYAHLFT